MLTQHVAIVPSHDGTNLSELSRVSAALQMQVLRDVGPIWQVNATVDVFPALEDVPLGYWPILLTFDELGGLEGIHRDDAGQPFGLVQLGKHWSLRASRVCIEMLTNPSGLRTLPALSPRSDQGAVEVLLEACSPCGAASHAYATDGVVVADFCTPAFYAKQGSPGGRYSFTGAASQPMRPLLGGHVTWYDPLSGNHWMRNQWDENPVDTQLEGSSGQSANVRSAINGLAPLQRGTAYRLREGLEVRIAEEQGAAQLRAHRLHRLLDGGRVVREGSLAQPPAFVPDNPVSTQSGHAQVAVASREPTQTRAYHGTSPEVPPERTPPDDHAPVDMAELQPVRDEAALPMRSEVSTGVGRPPRTEADTGRSSAFPSSTRPRVAGIALAGLAFVGLVVLAARGSQPARPTAGGPTRLTTPADGASAAVTPTHRAGDEGEGQGPTTDRMAATTPAVDTPACEPVSFTEEAATDRPTAVAEGAGDPAGSPNAGDLPVVAVKPDATQRAPRARERPKMAQKSRSEVRTPAPVATEDPDLTRTPPVPDGQAEPEGDGPQNLVLRDRNLSRAHVETDDRAGASLADMAELIESRE